MASKTERTIINAAGLVQGIVLVTFPAASSIFTDKSEYGLSSTQYGGHVPANNGIPHRAALEARREEGRGFLFGWLVSLASWSRSPCSPPAITRPSQTRPPPWRRWRRRSPSESALSSWRTGISGGIWPRQGQVFLGRFRTWIDTHEDQVIIAGCLIVGFWLIAHSIHLIVT